MAQQFALNLSLNLKDFRSGIASVRTSLKTFVGDFKTGAASIAAGMNVVANGVHIIRGAVDGVRSAVQVLTQFSAQGQLLEEGASKFEAVFKEVTASADAFARKLANDVGRSVIQVKNAMADTQGVLSGFGFDRGKAAEISQTVAQLAIDLASFNNTSDEDAAGALRSGLLGEAEALKKYGVALTETAVQQQAFQLGFDPSNMNEQEKVLTRLAIITKQTADAQGDAVRTSDSFANQAKRLSGVLFDLAATVGQGVNDALKPYLGAITKFFSENESQVRAAVGGVLGAIQGALSDAFDFLAPIAQRAGTAILAIFTDLPATILGVQAALERASSFIASIFSILTGGSASSGVALKDLQSAGVGVFERIEAALTAPGIIKGLGYLRLTVALLAGAFGELLAAGQLALSGIIGLTALSAVPLQKLLQVLGTVSGTARDAAAGLDDLIQSAIDKSIELSEDAQKKIVDIAARTAQEVNSATYDIQNADKIAKQFRAQAAARRENTKAEKETGDAGKKTLSTEEEKNAAAAKTVGTFKDQKEAQEAIKRATEETQRVEQQLADARAKSTDTLRDDLALIRERIAGELKAAKSAAEASQIRRRGQLQEIALVEEAQRKQAEATKKRVEDEKRAAKSLQEFITGQNRAGRRAKGLGAGVDVNEVADQFIEQAANVRTPEDAAKLNAEFKAAMERAMDIPREALRAAAEDVQNTRDALNEAVTNGDAAGAAELRDQLAEQRKTEAKAFAEAKDAGQQSFEASQRYSDALKNNLEAQAKKDAEVAAAAADVAAAAAETGANPDAPATTPTPEEFANFAQVNAMLANPALRPALDILPEEAPAAGDTATAAATPVEAAIETLRGVIEGANEALRAGLDSVAKGIGNLVAASQETLNASTQILPQAVAQLDVVLANQQAFGETLQSFAEGITTKFGEVATAFQSHSELLAKQNEAINKINISAAAAVDARTAGL